MTMILDVLGSLLTPEGGWSWRFVLRVVFSTLLLYVYVVLIARVFGSRTFASFTSYDFLTNIAAGSLVASAITGPNLVGGALGLTVLVLLQVAVSGAAARWTWISRVSDNAPVILVAHGRLQHGAMRRARVPPAILSFQLRQAGVTDLAKVRYAVLESGGSVSVVEAKGDEPEPPPADRPPPQFE